MDNNNQKSPNYDINFFFAYFLTWLTGIVFYFIADSNKDKRLKFHALQALFIGIIQIVIGLLFSVLFLWIVGEVLNVLILIYAWYVGFKASQGVDVDIPYITQYAKQYSGY
ncbi:MAG: hypothetical protein ACP5TL_02395 [Candidatus Micrarchaeia archaeon]